MTRNKRVLYRCAFNWRYLSYVMRNILLVSVKPQCRMAIMSKMSSMFVHGLVAVMVKDFIVITSNSYKIRFLSQP